MKKLIIIYIMAIPLQVYAQNYCGTTEIINRMIAEDSGLQKRIDSAEAAKQQRIKADYPFIKQKSAPKIQKQSGAYPCANNNTLYETFAAPATLYDSVASICIYAGEYDKITNMKAGYTYEIHTCNKSFYDTQISIYNASDGFPEAYNDDFCGTSSAIYFTPFADGDYNILIDQYDCISNSLCMELVVKLVYIPRQVITIPVVVHVVYNNSAENISDAQVYSQLNVLNKDFRRMNTDKYAAPTVFRGSGIDPLFEFCLAQRDPYGNATNGITRTYTNETIFDNYCVDNCIFYNSGGGKNAWNTSQYLNIWVCDLNSDPLGFAFLPGTIDADMDGVVIDYRVFGTINPANQDYNLGRTTTHEVGHWLGLYHPWGKQTCGSDSVFDTPQQKEANFGCPMFPHSAFECSYTGEAGTMFMNFMDYTDDDCKSMFTIGQFVRMDDAIFYPRYSIQNSIGCVPPATSAIAENITDSQINIFPNPNPGIFTLQTGKNYNISITDIAGRQIDYKKHKNLIKISKYSKGIYILRIKSEKEIINKKIVIN